MQPVSRSEQHGSEPFPEWVPTRLSRSATDWAITDSDARAVQGELHGLPPRKFAEAIELLERDGLLDTFLSEATKQTRAAFLDDAVAKGLVQSVSGRMTDKNAVAQPPDGPALLKNSPTLPSALRWLVHERNAAAAATYHAAHRAYIERYVGELDKAGSAFVIRSMGAPVAAFSLSEPGVLGTPGVSAALAKDWSLNVTHRHGREDRTTAHRALDDRLRSFVGAQRAGTLYGRALVELQASAGPVELTTEAGVKFTPGLPIDRELKQKLALKSAAGPLAIKQELSATTKAEINRALAVEIDTPVLAAGLKLKDDGTIRTELGLAYSELNARAGTLEGGLSQSVKIGDFKASVSAGVGFKGAERERAMDAAAHSTLFEPMPELEARRPFASLPEPRQKALWRAGIDQAAWEAELRRR